MSRLLETIFFVGISIVAVAVLFSFPKKKLKVFDMKCAVRNGHLHSLQKELKNREPFTDKKNQSWVLDTLSYAFALKKHDAIDLILDHIGDRQSQVTYWYVESRNCSIYNSCFSLMAKRAPHLIVNSRFLINGVTDIIMFKHITPCIMQATQPEWKKYSTILGWARSDLIGKFFLIANRTDIVTLVLYNQHLPNLLLMELIEAVCEPGTNCIKRFDTDRVINVIKKEYKQSLAIITLDWQCW